MLCFPSAHGYRGDKMTRMAATGLQREQTFPYPILTYGGPMSLLASAPFIEQVENLGNLGQISQLGRGHRIQWQSLLPSLVCGPPSLHSVPPLPLFPLPQKGSLLVAVHCLHSARLTPDPPVTECVMGLFMASRAGCKSLQVSPIGEEYPADVHPNL